MSEAGRRGLTEASVYQFRYALFSVLVEVRGELLLVKTSTKTEVVPRAALRLFYAPLIRGESYRELIIGYEHHGGMKRARVFSNLGEPQFDRLLADLSAELPTGDLSKLPAADAYEQLGARELSWIAVPLLMLLGVALVAVLASPYLIHGLEGSATTVELSHLERSSEVRATLSAHHLVLTGHLDTGYMVNKGKRARGFELLAPLYSTEGEARLNHRPAVIALLAGSGDLDLTELAERSQFQGIKRSIFWEGLSVQERRRLTERGLDLSAAPFVLEVDVRPSDDLTLYLALLTILLSLTGGVWWSLKPHGPR